MVRAGTAPGNDFIPEILTYQSAIYLFQHIKIQEK